MLRKSFAAVMLTLMLASTFALTASAVPIDLVTEVWALEFTLSAADVVEDDGHNRPDPTEEGDVIQDDEPSGPIKGDAGNVLSNN